MQKGDKNSKTCGFKDFDVTIDGQISHLRRHDASRGKRKKQGEIIKLGKVANTSRNARNSVRKESEKTSLEKRNSGRIRKHFLTAKGGKNRRGKQTRLNEQWKPRILCQRAVVGGTRPTRKVEVPIV